MFRLKRRDHLSEIPQPNDEGVRQATRALEKSHRDYADAVSVSVAVVSTALRVQSIRERNGFGPAIESMLGRPR